MSPLKDRLRTFATQLGARASEAAQKWKLRERIMRILPQDLAKSLPRTFEPMALAEWTGQALQRQGSAFYGRLITIFICMFFLADVTALIVGNYIPEGPAVRVSSPSSRGRGMRSVEDYNAIFARNLFNSKGLIPGDESTGQPVDNGGAPVRTTLPINLIGTLILRDELRSIATLEDKSASMVYPVRVNDEIPSKIRIIKVEARKVTFVNTSTGRREFIDMPDDASGTGPRITVNSSARPAGGAGIDRVSATQFNVARTEVDKALGNLNEVLTQARCVPNFENGIPSGFKCFQIVPGSIYDKLGLQNGDVLAGINGQPLNDPGEAFKLLGELKTANHLELQVKRDGRQQTLTYDIR